MLGHNWSWSMTKAILVNVVEHQFMDFKPLPDLPYHGTTQDSRIPFPQSESPSHCSIHSHVSGAIIVSIFLELLKREVATERLCNALVSADVAKVSRGRNGFPNKSLLGSAVVFKRWQRNMSENGTI